MKPEDANDSTTTAQIPRYAERKHIAIILTKNGIALLLDGAGKKIHLKKGVVTMRNALGLPALPERRTTANYSTRSCWTRATTISTRRRRNCSMTRSSVTTAVTSATTTTIITYYIRRPSDEHAAREKDGVGRYTAAEICARKPDAAAAAVTSRYDPARPRCRDDEYVRDRSDADVSENVILRRLTRSQMRASSSCST